ncbi:TPA: DUF748 domain-containing protein, partial [Burkholderia cepacia]|nr:DUF748 domain-containing protein [Burkholderia cepacia]
MASADKETVSSTLHALGGVARSRRTRRIGLGLLIFLVLFGLLGFFAAPPLIRHIAEQQLSQQLDRPATIRRIALNPYTLNLEADGIHLGDKGGQGDFIDIAKLVVRPSWSSLFRGAPIVNEVRLDSPQFHIVRYDAQRFNFTDLIEKFSTPSPKPESKPTQFSVSNIQVNNGRIDFDDRLLNEKHVVDNWTLGIPYIATLASKTDIFVEPKLRARFDGSPIAIDGKTKPFAQSRESEIALKFDGLDVPKLISYVPAKLPVAVTSGLLSSDLKVNFVMSGETPALRVSGTVDLNDAKVTDRASAPLFAARGVHVAAASLEPLRNALHFDEIRIDQPVVDLSRDKQGVLNVEKLAAQPAAASNAAEGKPAAPGAAPASAAAAAAASGAKVEAVAKAAPPLDLTIRHFAIDGGTVNVDDRVPATPTALSLTKLAATLDGFSMQGKTPAKYTLSTSLSRGGDVTAEGTFNLAEKQADSKLTVAALALPALQPYLGEATRARVLDGTLGATVNAKADWGKTPLAAQVADSTVSLKSLKIATPDAKAPAIVLPDASAKIAKVDVAARTAEIASVDASGLALDVQRLKDGRIDLAALAEPAQASVPKRTVARKAEAAAPSWHYRIDALNVKDSSANFTDLSTPRPVKLAIKPLELSVQKISDDMSKPLPVQLKATLNRKGSLNVTGDVTAQPLKLGLKINGNRLDAAAFEPYFGSALNATIASALLNAQGNLTFAQVKDAPRATYRGDVALVDVRMLDKATSDPFAGWRSLALTNLKANYDEKGTDVDAARVTFSNFYGRVLLDAQGRLNLKDVVAKETGPAQSLTRDASKGEP